MILTASGLSHVLSAQNNGVKIQLTSFQVGSGTNYVPTNTMTSLHGSILYSGNISTVEVIQNTVQFTCEVSEQVGPFTIGEIGIYADNILFAVGLVTPVFNKSPSVIWRSVVSLVLSTGASSISVNTFQSLPYITNIEELDSPTVLPENCVIVGTAHCNTIGDSFPSSVICTKYGSPTDISAWSFLGYTRTAHLVNTVVLSSTQFSVANFCANDGETVLVQVIVGDSTGQTRSFTYFRHKTVNNVVYNHVFTLVGTDVFTNLSNLDELNIWRSDSNLLPSVTGVQDGQTLQIIDGRPSWATAGGSYDVSQYRYLLKMVRSSFIGDGSTISFSLPSDPFWSIVMVDGVVQQSSAYSIIGNSLTFVQAPYTGTHEAILFIPDTSSAQTGSTVTMFSEEHTTGMGTSSSGYLSSTVLKLSNGPASAVNLLVFHAHLLRHSSDYTYDPVAKTITFNMPPVDGLTEVRWFVFTQTTDYCTPLLHKFSVVGNGQQLTVSVDPGWVSANSLIFTSGGYNDTSSYSLVNGLLTIPATIPGRSVETMVFDNSYTVFNSVIYRGDTYVPAVNSPFDVQKDGDIRTLNSFPEIYFNKSWHCLQQQQIPHVIEFDPTDKNPFDLQVIPVSKEFVRVNLGGTILMNYQYQINGSTLTLLVPNTVAMEVVVFNYWN